MQIEVFADVWCPFAHVGLRRFTQRRAESGADVGLLVRAWPLERVNGEPVPAELIAEEVAELRATVAPDLFAGFDPERFPTTTVPALELTCRAYAASPEVGEAVALELRDRLFERGQDVSEPAVLAEVAAAHGLDLDGADDDLAGRDWEEGRGRGVIGSPHFFTPGGSFFCPALEVRQVDGHLRITADPEGFQRFLDSCFAAG